MTICSQSALKILHKDQRIQKVLKNLLISKIELRSEESPDVKDYIHVRDVETIVIQLDEDLKALKENYMKIIRKYVGPLIDLRILFTRDETVLTKFQILKAREAFRQNPPVNLSRQQSGILEGTFALCMKLYHGLELLNVHGARSLYKYLLVTMENKIGAPSTYKLLKDSQYIDILEKLQEKYGETKSFNNPVENSSQRKKFTISHPKLKKLLDIVIDHFSKVDRKSSTRIMIFSQYRESVLEITEMLQEYRPLIRAMSFIGQSNANKSNGGFTQKQQLQVVKEFKSGEYNTLISTCVGEEGLDIGEVDLIICYDAQKSPIRIVQRMGRTGRKRDGKIIVLVMEGKEQQDYKHCLYQMKKINNILSSGKNIEHHLHQNSHRMIPADIEPVCVKLKMQVKEWQNKESSRKAKNCMQNLFDRSDKNNTVAPKNMQFLTEEQMLWYKNNLQVTSENIKTIQLPSMLSNFNELCTTKKAVDLGEFQPWQTTLQSCMAILHSKKSENLIHLTHFIGLQSFTDENEYGDTLKRYFNNDYFKKDEEENINNEVPERKKRKKNLIDNYVHKKQRGHIPKTTHHIDVINKTLKPAEDNIFPYDDNDIVILDEVNNVKLSNEFEKSGFENLNLENINIDNFSLSNVKTLSFEPPPVNCTDVTPLNQMKVKEICKDIILQWKNEHVAQLNNIFIPNSKEIHKHSHLSNGIYYGEGHHIDILNNTFHIEEMKVPILNLNQVINKPTNMTSTPNKTVIHCPNIEVTPIIPRKLTDNRESINLQSSIPEDKSNLIKNTIKLHRFDKQKCKENQCTNIGLNEIHPNQNAESLNLSEPLAGINKESLFSNIDEDICNRSKYSQNFNLVDLSFDKPIQNDFSPLHSRMNSIKKNTKHSQVPLNRLNIKNTTEIPQPKFSNSSVLKNIGKNSLMSITQVLDIVNEPSNVGNKSVNNENNIKEIIQNPLKCLDKSYLAKDQSIPSKDQSISTEDQSSSTKYQSISTKKQYLKEFNPEIVKVDYPTFNVNIDDDLFDIFTKPIMNVSSSCTNSKWISCNKNKLKKSTNKSKINNLLSISKNNSICSNLKPKVLFPSDICESDCKIIFDNIDLTQLEKDQLEVDNNSNRNSINNKNQLHSKSIDTIFSNIQSENTPSNWSKINILDKSNLLDSTEKSIKNVPNIKLNKNRQIIDSDSDDNLTINNEYSLLNKRNTSHNTEIYEKSSPINPKLNEKSTKNVSFNINSRNLTKKRIRIKNLKVQEKNIPKFIELEANVSGEIISTDESETELNCYDESFINDITQLTQNVKDMKGIYLQSVRSPVMKSIIVGKARKSIKSVYSQQYENSYDEDDEEDSFVVSNDFVEYETQLMENSLPADESLNISKELHEKNKKRKRIIKYSSSEEENTPKKLSCSPNNSSIQGDQKSTTQLNNFPLQLQNNLHTSIASEASNLFNQNAFSSEEFFEPMNKSKCKNDRQFNKSNSALKKSCNKMDLASKQIIVTTKEVNSNSTVRLSQSISSQNMTCEGKVCVMIDSNEINTGGLISSHLQHKCGVNIYVAKISPANYILSSRVAVYRIKYSVLSKSSNRHFIVEHIKGLLMLYERPTLIVETDNNSDIQNHNRSNYLDTITCALMQLPQLKVIYSNCQEDTCYLLEHLLRIEKIKGYNLPNINFSDDHINKVYKFYAAIPLLSPASAIILASKYTNIFLFMSSFPESFGKESNISKEQRNYILSHFRRKFNKNFLPPKY